MGNIAGNQRYQDGGTLPGADFIYPIQKNLPNPPMKEVRLTVPKGHPANKPLEVLDPVNKYKLLVGVNSAQSPPGSEIITQIPALECMITSTLTTAPPGCAVEMQRPVVFEMVGRGTREGEGGTRAGRIFLGRGAGDGCRTRGGRDEGGVDHFGN